MAPSNVLYTHCEFNAIVQLASVPPFSGAAQRLYMQAYCDGPADSTLHDLVIPEETVYRVEYYNATKTRLLDGHFTKLDGTFAVREARTPGAYPSLYLRADLLSVVPGEVTDEDYDLRCPPISTPKLCGAGSVVAHHTDPSGRRLFLLSITTYVGPMGEDPEPESKYSTWRLWCDLPTTPRWQSTQVPRVGRLCLVSGNLIGFYRWEGVLLPCVTLTNLSYLPTDAVTSAPAQMSAVTPSNRKRPRNLLGTHSPRAPAAPAPAPSPAVAPAPPVPTSQSSAAAPSQCTCLSIFGPSLILITNFTLPSFCDSCK